MTSTFASHQRWLLAQSGFALYCSRDPADPTSGLYAARFIDLMVEHKVASRNTAAAFLQEMQAYKFLQPSPDAPNRRTRPLEPTAVAIGGMMTWLTAHAAILDHLDSGRRNETIAAHPELLKLSQPKIAAGIVRSPNIRSPGTIFDLFGWANSGSLIMDWLVANMQTGRSGGYTIPVTNISFSDMSSRFLISKTHLKRLFHKAADLGGLGWSGEPGRSEMWISLGFFGEFRLYQAEKFAIVDKALGEAIEKAGFAPALPEPVGAPLSRHG
ncbi:hypothetical protein [Pararhizobium sp.]|uniref:hypothetical protein n=1 Tax=Pararhizobium sp. TaxID=1977563 RepID=UPI00271A4278|nr:hypothetical protein [Pararhizobium sp.]MDO9414728.1 hypothetical protein [Pararhizobium sp.]